MDRRDAIRAAANADRERAAVARRQPDPFQQRLQRVRATKLKSVRKEFMDEISRIRRGEPAGKNKKAFSDGAGLVNELLGKAKEQRELAGEIATPAKTFLKSYERFEGGAADAILTLAIAGTKVVELLLKKFGPADEPANREARRAQGR